MQARRRFVHGAPASAPVPPCAFGAVWVTLPAVNQGKAPELVSQGDALSFDRHSLNAIPPHRQALAWGTKRNVDPRQLPNNDMFYRWVTLK